MSNFEYLNKHRIREGHFASTDDMRFTGAFQIVLFGAKIKIIASDGEGWRHVSASIHNSKEPPNWKMMCAIKELFWDDEDVVVQYHPRKSEYINNHPGCLHLWQPLNEIIPTPPKIFVGV